MKEKMILVLLSVLLVAGSILGVSCSKRGEKKNQVANTEKSPEAKSKAVYCPFCGDKLDPDTELQRPIAVMVENLKQVRPQYGLDEACVVVEALTEGGITRFMMVFANKDVGRIGPVRSARSHYVAIAKGMNAIYAHAGGSKFALADIKGWNLADVDQLKRDDAFWRTKGGAPHNLWTSTYKVRSEAKVLGYSSKAKASGFKFKSLADLEERPESQDIVIDFSGPAYKVEYEYIRDTNGYLRSNAGVIHKDAISGSEIAPKNIVIVFAPTSSIPGGGQVLDVDVVGKNKCLVFTDGKVIEGTWEKESEKAPFYLYNDNEKQIQLNPGQTWIEVVKPNTKISYDKGDMGDQ